ncbi:MAG: HD family phosphohydrolase [Oscillospiraceae bacterium]|nr:HD family phosphohydrolase [Oscillospiraceae bacterium]
MLNAIGSKIDLSVPDSECGYYELVSDLLDSEVVQQMQQYMHHGHTTCFQHCLNVSYYNYLLCKLLSLDCRAGARAGLLHDLFLYDWHDYVKVKGQRMHGWTHAGTALANVRKYFSITPMEADIIEKHMFPMNIALPKYRETVVIICVDKICGAWEVVAHWGYLMKLLATYPVRKHRERLAEKGTAEKAA